MVRCNFERTRYCGKHRLMNKTRSTFKRLVRPLIMRVTKNHIYSIRKGIGKGFKIKGGTDFIRVKSPEVEERFLRSLIMEGQVIYDIGSHIGVLTMFFAKSAGPNGKVISFDANPINVENQKINLELNGLLGTVKIVNIGIGDANGMKRLVFNRNQTAYGSLESNIQKDIAMRDSSIEVYDIEVDTLDNCLHRFGLPEPNLIKIDIEGYEYNALLGMNGILSSFGPQLYIELHGANDRNKILNLRKIYEFLDSHAYSIYNVELEKTVNPSNIFMTHKGHIFCQKHF